MKGSITRSLTVSALLGLTLGACSLDPATMGPDVTDGPYRDGFALINVAPFTSGLPGGSLIDVWISEFAAAEYDRVTVEGTGSNVSLPVGTVIVREVLDENREVTALTLMIKNDPGYFPGGGDWWYGVAEPDGIIRLDNDGNPLMGALIQCGGCHASRANDDFLFGVPQAYH